jgi:GNAT superfamily N-acetyltransferase
MLQIYRLVVGDEQALREIRLRSLLDTPTAYGSTYERESALVETDWRGRLARTDAATFVCQRDDGVAIGLVTGMIDESSAIVAWLMAMWVDPKLRRKGVARLLIDEVITWSRVQNCTTLRLHVTEGNARAERVYKRHGFRRTGSSELRERDNMIEFEMELTLSATPEPHR